MQIRLDTPLDMHLHLRDKEILKTVAPLSAKSFSGALIMPNLIPPITTKEALLNYKDRIINSIGNETFTPYMTLFFKNDYSYEFLKDVKDDIIAIKLYPTGITTNSDGGVDKFDIERLRPTLEAMSSLDIPLSIHGESNGFVMDREKEFIPIYEELASSFPKLKIIMEHITTKDSVEALKRHSNLYATITIHHLLITLDDVVGGMLNPHLFCKPIAKRYKDREALQKVALEANPKVMFGSDSAPHPQNAKEASHCSAGIFTAPIALQLLTQLFMDKNSSIDNLQKFISSNAKKIYNISPKSKIITLEKRPFIVPTHYDNIIPMYASQKIDYTIINI
jgi:dihydroorotase